ncbi:MAG: type I secretion C-terminal target domain-containing protein [Pseudorhodoplanes sp.]|nr:type I secretion C-terminal target domain-containing protein [Pseudorhodoplanes sp.]
MGYTDLIKPFNFTNLPNNPITASGNVYSIGYTFLTQNDVSHIDYGSDTDYYGPSSVWETKFDPLTSAQKNAVRTILQDPLVWSDSYSVYFGDVAPISFAQTSDGAIAIGQMTYDASVFSNTGTLAGTGPYTGPGDSEGYYGDIWFNSSVGGWSSFNKGSEQFWAVLHELGHAMGLRHPTASSAWESEKYTIMVPSSDPGDGYVLPGMSSGGTVLHASGLQLYDIAAIQDIYQERNYATRGVDDPLTGSVNEANTVYGVTHGFGSATSTPFIYTIWDGAGVDLIDASGYSHHALIDLRQGAFSSIGNAVDTSFNPGTVNGFAYDVGQAKDNVAVAYYALIENAFGTSGEDSIVGNAWTNVLYGGLGADKLYGDGSSYDSDAGFHTANTLADQTGAVNNWGPDGIAYAGDLSGKDVLIGGAGNDTLYAGKGNDILHGEYNKADIDSATSGWAVYWDVAGQFTDTNNAAGVALVNYDSPSDYWDTADYSRLDLGTSTTGISATFSDSLNYGLVSKGASGTFGSDTLFAIDRVIGTNQKDTFTGSNGGTIYYEGGDRSDSYVLGLNNSGVVLIAEQGFATGVDVITLNSSWVGDIYVPTLDDHMGIAFFLSYGGDDLQLGFNASKIGDGYGVESIQIGSSIIRAAALQQWADFMDDGHYVENITLSNLPAMINAWSASGYNGGSGGVGAGGNVLPQYNGGSLTGMNVAPSITQSYVSYAYASETMHPFIVTNFATGGGTTTITYDSFVQYISFIGGISQSDIRLTATSVQGDAGLNVYLDDYGYSFTVSKFETGKTINGYGYYGQALHAAVQDSSTATLTGSGGGHYSGSYNGTGFGGFSFTTSMSDTYFLDALVFSDSSSLDLTGSLTFEGTGAGETVYGLNSRADTVLGLGGNDTLYAYGGNDILNGGLGNDTMYGGAGDDSYYMETGFGADTVNESTSAGSDTIRFVGIDPADIRMYTDTSGYLHLVQISDTNNNLTVVAATTGSGSYESTIGTRVESVTFDSGYSTTWDLTGGLTLTGTNGGSSLYGTAYGDTIYGGSGTDSIYGNGGNDTIIGGAGPDTLRGGTGNDTFKFSSGFGSATITEYASEGTDTVRFVGIDPANIRMWTDTSGHLHLQDSADTSHNITVQASVTGAGSYESTIGTRVESVTFDAGYSTTWDLTSGLSLANTNSGGSLYGTAYGDILTGGTGTDTIYGNGGNDTIISGAGPDTLRGGTGNDTFKFSSGFGSATITEYASEGTDTVRFIGIDPTNIRMWTDTSGHLHLQDSADTSHNITVQASVTGAGSYESTIGGRVESVTFDAGYSTTWDLTGGLSLANTNSGGSLYGTAYGDILTGGTGTDTIYGNGGNDTIISGAGADTLRGGTGDDTYKFSSGFGSATITEYASEGTDTIRFVGIDPANIRMWTDTSGHLHLQDSADPSHNITVQAGVTGAGNYESIIGTRVESITFDAGYSTTWSLTAGLTLTGTSSGESLYGTAYGDTINGMGGADTIYGNGGNDTLIGGSSGDTLRGGNDNDVLQGNGGTDNLYGESGADTFMFKAATALSASDNIQDFSTGAGDKIDISDVISGYDPLSHAITDWVQITTSGSNSLLKVDTDGAANGANWQQIATIIGVTGLTDEAALVANGNLIAHAA